MPVVAGDVVLAGCRDFAIHGLALADGAPLWTHSYVFSWVESSPAIVGGVAYFGSSDLRSVRAIATRSGRTLWTTDVRGLTWGTPVVAGERIYAGTAGQKDVLIAHRPGWCALDRRTGALLWRHARGRGRRRHRLRDPGGRVNRAASPPECSGIVWARRAIPRRPRRAAATMTFKQPLSVLVLVYTTDLDVLLIERADFPGHWQSVTGSVEVGETLVHAAVRELAEETGIDAAAHGGVVDWRMQNVFEIFAQWRHRYPPGTTHNTEHVFGLEVPAPVTVALAPREHLRHAWLPWRDAAQRCFSWTNRAAIDALPLHARQRTSS